MNNLRRKLLLASSSIAVLALLQGTTSALRIGDVCHTSRLASCGICESGDFQPIQGGDKLLCAPKNGIQCEITKCGCCSDLNGHLSYEQCLPEHLCQSQKAVGEACSYDAQCESMACVSSACQEIIPVVRRMLQTDPTTTTNTTTTGTNSTTTPTNTSATTNSTNNVTTNTTSNTTYVEPFDPVSALNYSCFMCAH